MSISKTRRNRFPHLESYFKLTFRTHVFNIIPVFIKLLCKKVKVFIDYYRYVKSEYILGKIFGHGWEDLDRWRIFQFTKWSRTSSEKADVEAVQWNKFPEKRMVWLGVSGRGTTPLIYFKTNVNGKRIGDTVFHLLSIYHWKNPTQKTRLEPILTEKFPIIERLKWFQILV